MSTIRDVPVLRPAQRITSVFVSQADYLSRCPLRLVLGNDGLLRALTPTLATAILGSAAHDAIAWMSRAARAAAAGDSRTTRNVAQEAFDRALELLCVRRDEQIAERGSVPGECTEPARRLPFYGLARARFVRLARVTFGDEWRWAEPKPAAAGEGPSQPVLRPGRNSEVPLHQPTGFLRGIADVIEVNDDGTAIEELKSGELEETRLPAWKLQLLLYGYLCDLSFGVEPKLLRIVSLHGGKYEFAYDPALAKNEVARLTAARDSVNESIAAGARFADLAKPSPDVCTHCSQRIWCAAYWNSEVSSTVTGDAAGNVSTVDGWRVTISPAHGSSVSIDFRWYGVVPNRGDVVRISGLRTPEDGQLVADQTTAVWRVP